MSYEHFEELNKLKFLLRELGIYKMIEELRSEVEELKRKISMLELSVDELGDRIFDVEVNVYEQE